MSESDARNGINILNWYNELRSNFNFHCLILVFTNQSATETQEFCHNITLKFNLTLHAFAQFLVAVHNAGCLMCIFICKTTNNNYNYL